MANDFAITNALLPNQLLNPGERHQLRYRWEENEAPHIRLNLEDCLIREGVDYAPEKLKVIVSTTELNTEDFNMLEGLCPERTRAKGLADPRAGRKELPLTPDWRIYDINFITHLRRPLEVLPTEQHGHYLLSAKQHLQAQLYSAQAVASAIKEPYWWLDNQLAPQPKRQYEWTAGFNRAHGLSFVAVAPTQGGHVVDGFGIQFPSGVDTNGLYPVLVNSSGALSVLPYHWEQKKLCLAPFSGEPLHLPDLQQEVYLITLYYIGTD